MVNGTTAKITSYTVAALAIIIAIGMIILSLFHDPIPDSLVVILTTLVGFLVGTRFTPIGVENSDSHGETSAIKDK